MNKLKYFTLLAAAGVLGGYNAEAMVLNPPRFNVSLRDAIFKAAHDNKPEQLQKYLNLGYSIDISDERGMTALCRAKSEGDDAAYAMLYKYGADENAPCMKDAESIYRTQQLHTAMRYGGMALLAGGVVGAFAMSSGGGSGGSSSGGSSGGSSDYVPNSNGKVSDDVNFNPVLNSYSKVTEFSTEDEWNGNSEFNGSNFQNSVNYLGGINAAKAFAKYYGKDADGNFASNLSEVSVGVADTGVWGNHPEFKTDGGYKTSGANWDGGPCSDTNPTLCWHKTEGAEVQCTLLSCALAVSFRDENGKDIEGGSAISCDLGSDAANCFNKWAAAYPSDYTGLNSGDYYYPNYVSNTLGNTDDLHGSHVAGIIGANIDGKGNMGVAGVNSKIYAIRWDLKLDLPLVDFPDGNGNSSGDVWKNMTALNLSIGTTASASSNASMAAASLEGADSQLFEQLLGKQTTNENGKIDGTILVKAAGNDSYEQPDLWSGIKLNDKYKDLLMTVVVAVDTTIGDDGTISYKLSEYSNQCGSASGYCLAALGGNYATGESGTKFMWSVGETGSDDYEYINMMGTSMATPVVTGAIAFIKGAYNWMSGEEIIDLMMTTANKNASDYSAEKYGAGLLDLGAAVTTYVSENGTTSTFGGNSVRSERINIGAAHLSVPSVMKSAMQKALPQSVTVFDKYNRPFAYASSNLVSVTHGGYKVLKNDVYQIARPAQLSQVQNGNMSFAFAGSAGSSNGSGMGFMQADYNGGSYNSGFYFSENTRYENGGSFAEASANPFMAMQNAYGIYNTFNFNKNLGLKLEAVTGRNGLYDGESSYHDGSFKKQAYALNSELQLHKGEKFGVSLTNGLLYEEAATLGMNGSGAFGAQDSGTYNAGVKASWYVTPQLTLTGSYYRGYTQGQSFESNLLKTSDLVSESFAFDANYKVSKQTEIGFNVSSPLRVVDGTLSVNFPSGRDSYSDEVYFSRYQAALKPEAREYKFAMYASHSFSDKLSLRSELDVRVNPEHQRQANDYRALLGLNWNFN